MAKPCCERSEPTSAAGAVPRAWGSGFPTKIGCKRASAGCLFNRQNLALRENNSPSFCVSPAAVVAAGCPPQTVRTERKVGYKVDISKTKSGYKLDTFISNL